MAVAVLSCMVTEQMELCYGLALEMLELDKVLMRRGCQRVELLTGNNSDG
jgi:hypothetical protein